MYYFYGVFVCVTADCLYIERSLMFGAAAYIYSAR